VAPLAPRRYAPQVTLGQDTYDKLRHVQALLGHQLPAGDLAQALDRARDALIVQLEWRKFAATSCPKPVARRASRDSRRIPAAVKREVRARDQGRCTFVSEAGERCPARTGLEFDHVLEVARGGEATTGNLRLRCRGHNPYAAEDTFGAGFMHEKRERARVAAEARRRGAEVQKGAGEARAAPVAT
jgi:hypothetical protein